MSKRCIWCLLARQESINQNKELFIPPIFLYHRLHHTSSRLPSDMLKHSSPHATGRQESNKLEKQVWKGCQIPTFTFTKHEKAVFLSKRVCQLPYLVVTYKLTIAAVNLHRQLRSLPDHTALISQSLQTIWIQPCDHLHSCQPQSSEDRPSLNTFYLTKRGI